MSEDKLRAAMGTAVAMAGIVGSLIGSGLARKVAGKDTFFKILFGICRKFTG